MTDLARSSLIVAVLLLGPAAAQFGAPPVEKDPAAAPIARALHEAGPEARTFDLHVTTLANPFMEGRVPGSRGMEIARDYVEHYLRLAGTEPPFRGDDGQTSYRQPFPLGGSRTIEGASLHVGDIAYLRDRDFVPLGFSGAGALTAPLVFVGYSIESGPDDFTSYPGDEKLDGKIAVMFRFEPMDEDGRSKWAREGQGWSRHQSSVRKAGAARRRGAAGVIFVNPPGADDPRASELMTTGTSRGVRGFDIPAVAVSDAVAAEIVETMAPAGTTLASLRAHADRGGAPIELAGGAVDLQVDVEEQELTGYNVCGLIRGRGALQDEYVVIGGHIDHLGLGRYGARDPNRIGQLHPGADDNASGTAALLMLAERITRAFAALPDDAHARSVLIAGFDAEESGLNGSRHYVEHPIAPLDKHALMINFDMIGRITNKRLLVDGSRSAEGMQEWLKPLFEESPLEIVENSLGFGGSDHMSFQMRQVPYLFAIIADFHNDYHTPDDTVDKINRVDAVHTIDLFEKIALTAATRTAPFVWNKTQGEGRRRRR